MITCPVCQHRELEGELFCSDCGARLQAAWPDVTLKTAFVETPRARAATASGTGGLDALEPGQIALSLNGVGQPIILSGRAQYILGREGQDQVVPDLNLSDYGAREKGVSRVHAALRQERDQLLLVDLGSTNGTRLNGTLVTAHQPVRVRSGDEIRLGKLTLKVRFVFSAGPR